MDYGHKLYCCYILSHISVATSASFPVLFLLSYLWRRNSIKSRKLHKKETETKTRAEGKRKRMKKDKRQTWKASERIEIVLWIPLNVTLRPHGLHLAIATLPPLICHVIGHWALVTTDWDVLYHWHWKLSLSCLLLHHFIAFQSGLCVCVAFVYEAVSWVWFPILS